MRCRNKPNEAEYVYFDGQNYKECKEFIGEHSDKTANYPNVISFGEVCEVMKDTYILKYAEDCFIPISKEDFEDQFEKINDD